MNTTMEQIKTQAVTLSPSERAELAHFLLVSLEPDEDGDSRELWAREIEERSRAFAQGGHQATDWHEAIREIRQSLE